MSDGKKTLRENSRREWTAPGDGSESAIISLGATLRIADALEGLLRELLWALSGAIRNLAKR